MGEQGRQVGPEGPEQGRHGAHAQRGDDDHLQGDTLGLGGFAHAETVAHQDGNAHVEGHARQEEQGFDAQSGGEARQGIDAVEGQGCHQDEEHEVAGLPDDLGRSRGQGHLEQIGKAAPQPAHGGQGPAAQVSGPAEQQAVGHGPQALGTGIGPGDAHIAHAGQAEPAQTQPQTAQQVENADRGRHPERRQDLPGGTEHDAGGGVDILGGQGQHGDAPETGGDRQDAFRDLKGAQDGTAQLPAQQGHQDAGQQAAQDGGAHIALGTAQALGPQRLADRCRGAAGHGHGHDHEEQAALVDHAERGLHVGADASGHPDIDEAHEEDQIHHEHLRPGELPYGAGGNAEIRFRHGAFPKGLRAGGTEKVAGRQMSPGRTGRGDIPLRQSGGRSYPYVPVV